MTETVVQLDGVSKRYLLGEHHGSNSARDAIADWARRLLHRQPAAPPREIWSLKNVDLRISEGETVGIIGRNGAGKSTLLKIITRITEPTRGVARMRGRVGSLLEVGTGFHPELTGRENVFLNGVILGMGRREIRRRFDEIADFAGVTEFLDTPVKRYSSGMYLRLAFAVAAHLDTEIMVVDEVLAVGDAEFQRKCLRKMGSLERQGRTVVFVSHNLDAIMRLCRRGVWLDKGVVRCAGPMGDVVSAYLAAGSAPVPDHALPEQPDAPVAVERVRLLDAVDSPSAVLARDDPFTVEVQFVVRERLPRLDMTVFIENLRGVRVLDEAWSDATPSRLDRPGRYVARLTVPPVLTAGDYVAGFWLGTPYETVSYMEDVLSFRLEGGRTDRAERIMQLMLPWDIRMFPPSPSGEVHRATS